mmetsp:Transcript_100034/g.280279  ORF Transcript_100034/g.280279 Transcript_100034/m.280279 type:complete len:282 (+) Transcript_100034:520-1365(+)
MIRTSPRQRQDREPGAPGWRPATTCLASATFSTVSATGASARNFRCSRRNGGGGGGASPALISYGCACLATATAPVCAATTADAAGKAACTARERREALCTLALVLMSVAPPGPFMSTCSFSKIAMALSISSTAFWSSALSDTYCLFSSSRWRTKALTVSWSCAVVSVCSLIWAAISSALAFAWTISSVRPSIATDDSFAWRVRWPRSFSQLSFVFRSASSSLANSCRNTSMCWITDWMLRVPEAAAACSTEAPLVPLAATMAFWRSVSTVRRATRVSTKA